MQRYAVLGTPIAHSLSPRMQQAAFDALGLQASYEAIDVSLEDLAHVTARLRHEFAGWNVTTPLKEAAARLVDSLTEPAAGVRAANTIRREPGALLLGHNTDGVGFLRAVTELWSWEAQRSSVLILGAGPAAKAIAAVLEHSGCPAITCWSRTAASALRIGPPPQAAADLVVCALPASATLPPQSQNWSHAASLLFDLNYGTGESPLRPLPGRGRSDGLPMLLHQGALSFEWWTGARAPLEVMRDALKRANTAPPG